MPIGFLMALVLALGIGAFVLGKRAEQRRRAELTSLCERRGWRLSPAHDDSMEDRYAEFPSLGRGDDRYAFNVVEGPLPPGKDDGGARRCCAFDYHYETYSTDSKGHRQTRHHHFSALVVECALPLQSLSIRPETFFDRIGEFFGADDIDFESAEFSRAFHVKAGNRKWAFDVIHQETMEFLLAAPRFMLEFRHGRVLVRRESVWQVADLEQALDVACGVLDRLPGYLLREWRQPAR